MIVSMWLTERNYVLHVNQLRRWAVCIFMIVSMWLTERNYVLHVNQLWRWAVYPLWLSAHPYLTLSSPFSST